MNIENYLPRRSYRFGAMRMILIISVYNILTMPQFEISKEFVIIGTQLLFMISVMSFLMGLLFDLVDKALLVIYKNKLTELLEDDSYKRIKVQLCEVQFSDKVAKFFFGRSTRIVKDSNGKKYLTEVSLNHDENQDHFEIYSVNLLIFFPRHFIFPPLSCSDNLKMAS